MKKKQIPATNRNRSWKSLGRWGVLLLSFTIIAFLLWRLPRGALSSSSKDHQGPTAKMSRGETLARSYCQMCHLFVEPSYLSRFTWKEQVLPEMKAYLGLNRELVEIQTEAKHLLASGAFASAPMLSAEDWNLIESYYLSNAPEEQPTNQLPKIGMDLAGFDLELPPKQEGPPEATLTFIDEKHREILVGDMGLHALKVCDSTGQTRQIVPMNNTPVSVWPTELGIYITCIGPDVKPSQIPMGSLSFLPRRGDQYGSPKVLLSGLPRPVQSTFGDLNGDGRPDLVISMFGHLGIGRLSWFENLGKDKFQEHELVHRDGTIQTKLVDMDGDGFLDILVLTAQSTESMEIFYNNGKGEFTQKVIFQKRPLFAHTHFELVDFNGDGKPDLIVSNGATGEHYTSPLKSFHGLRIYLNQGNEKFEESFFFPLHGIYQFVIGDFDRDGDVDIAAVSYYPDYRKLPQECFVYLENQGNFSFHASTFPDSLAGRWITVAAGDLDGDNDLDLVLGSKYNGPSSVPKILFEDWKTKEPSFVILRNRFR